MSVMTVLGPVEESELGVVLPHEHLVSNAVGQWLEPADDGALAEAIRPFALERRGAVQTRPFSHRDAMQQLLLEPALVELERFRALGGGTVVDLGIPGFGRDHVALRVLARLSGVNVVMGCGEYTEAQHAGYVRHVSAEVIRDVLLDELTLGVGRTGIRAGVIGELGTGNPLTDAERKVLTGAALAQRETGVAVNVHRTIFPDAMAGLEAVDHLLGLGVDPAAIVVSHCDERPGAEFALAVAERGAWAELDTFGMEQWAVSAERDGAFPPRALDPDRIEVLLALLDAGHGDRVLLSHDLAMKPQFSVYGGWGLTHLSEHVEPRLRALGVDQETLRRLRVENPRAALSPGTPRSAA